MGIRLDDRRRPVPRNWLRSRAWLTAKAARLLGHDVPDDIQDDEVVIFTAPRSAP